MNPKLLYNVFMRDFRKQKKRMTLTILAIAWGSISIMLLLAFGEGLKSQMLNNQRGLGEGISIMWGGQTSIPFQGLGKGRPIRFTSDDVEYLQRRMPELRHVAGEYTAWGTNIKYKDKIFSERVTGVYPCYEDIRTHYPMSGGRFINNLDMEQKRRVVFLGDELKTKLFGAEDAVGKQVLINSIPFMVIGVMQKKNQMSMYNGPDAACASIPATTFAAIYGYQYFSLMIYQPKDISTSAAVETRVYEVMGAKHKFDPKDERALSIWDVAQEAREFSNIMMGIQIFLGLIGGMSLLIAGVGVANIMYVSIKERTREIGIKMAVGAKRKYILIQFLVESLSITAVGGFFGMSLSYILTEAFKRIPIQSDVLDFMGRPTVSAEIGLIVVAVLGVIGFVSGIFPAAKAASVNPVESLRYE
ncbi:MAG: ABC transporter permease [candidate division Zixibacteria bacterium]|nr:ABC transporter permease [candidate division Zixibacteria bacterium]